MMSKVLVDTSVWLRFLRLSALLDDYGKLPSAARVPHDKVVALVVARDLRGRGVGWIDAHLVAAALIAKAQLWTADERPRAVAERLRIGA